MINIFNDTSMYGLTVPYDSYGNVIYPSDTKSPKRIEILIYRESCDKLGINGKSQVLTHEIGHALGLAHTKDGFWDSTDSVMDEDDTFDFNSPTTYDSNNLKAKY